MSSRNQDSLYDFIHKSHYDDSLDLYRTIDLKGNIIACNKAYAQSLGYSIKEIIGLSMFVHVDEKSIKDIKQTFEKWRSTGIVKNHEIWLRRKDGTTFPVLLSASNLYDQKGKLIGTNTVMRDISEIYHIRKEMEEIKLKRLTTMGELSARIAHDLRNPLSIIKTTIEFIEAHDDQALSKYSTYFSKIHKSITRMTHQIEEVLEYVRPQSLDIKTYSIRNVISDSIEKFMDYPDVKISVPRNDIKIKCDAEKLEIVFLNLVLNAIQAMNNKGKIDIEISEKGNHAIIQISDTGPGIPDDLLPKIFDPLFTTRQIGTGLGLPSCKNIVEKHGGDISVKTRIGKGTTFFIKIPKKPSGNMK